MIGIRRYAGIFGGRELGDMSTRIRAEANGVKVKAAANRADRSCNELKQEAPSGDKPVRAPVRAVAVCSDNTWG